MSKTKLGVASGALRDATVLQDNGDGTMLIGIADGDVGGPKKKYNVPVPSAWMGKDGQFIGGFPIGGATVVVAQGAGGAWYVVSYLLSNNDISDTYNSSGKTKIPALKDGRALMQVRGGNRIFVDPTEGAQIGSSTNFVHANPNRNIVSHTFFEELAFTESSRSIFGIVKRDIKENSNRNVLGSTLTSHRYDEALSRVSLDSAVSSGRFTGGSKIRNVPFVENREVIYEFAHSYKYTTDEDESDRYEPEEPGKKRLKVSRREMRTDALSLSLEHPNHLIETIKGTAVDTFGNILDLNRAILPIGKIDDLSLKRAENKSEAFARIRAQLRKSIAYHFELNARKGISDSDVIPPPDTNITEIAPDYGRNRSRFSIDVDKEGQFKINIPASSETGNVPLPTRHENFSVLLAHSEHETDPNEFIREKNNQEIFLEQIAEGQIKLSATDDALDGYAAPVSRITNDAIKLGTVFHDVTATCVSFQKRSKLNEIHPDNQFAQFFDEHHLNTDLKDTLLESIVSDNIFVSGEKADAGGRSGWINLDGFLGVNIGANTVDRQSMWFDCAGSIISNIGKDKNNISYACNLDGDVFIEIGTLGPGNTADSRFSDTNDAQRISGTIDIRVNVGGQLMIFRMGSTPSGDAQIDLVSPGGITIACSQDMLLYSGSKLMLDAKEIVMYPDTYKKIVGRQPGTMK